MTRSEKRDPSVPTKILQEKEINHFWALRFLFADDGINVYHFHLIQKNASENKKFHFTDSTTYQSIEVLSTITTNTTKDTNEP